MKEAIIRKKAIRILNKKGFTCWYAPKAKFQECDLFSIWDIVCGKDEQFKWIQLTTLSNISARRKKINNYLAVNNIKFKQGEIWGWHKKLKVFKIINI